MGFVARGRGRDTHCANCGCPLLDHLQDEEEAELDDDAEDYAPQFASVGD